MIPNRDTLADDADLTVGRYVLELAWLAVVAIAFILWMLMVGLTSWFFGILAATMALGFASIALRSWRRKAS